MLRILIVLFAVIALTGCDEPDPEAKCNNDELAKIGAFVASQYFVEKKLRSPSTADFPYFSTSGVSVSFVKKCHFKVLAFVDSQNGFGATIRSRYFINIEARKENGDYWGRNLIIE